MMKLLNMWWRKKVNFELFRILLYIFLGYNKYVVVNAENSFNKPQNCLYYSLHYFEINCKLEGLISYFYICKFEFFTSKWAYSPLSFSIFGHVPRYHTDTPISTYLVELFRITSHLSKLVHPKKVNRTIIWRWFYYSPSWLRACLIFLAPPPAPVVAIDRVFYN